MKNHDQFQRAKSYSAYRSERNRGELSEKGEDQGEWEGEIISNVTAGFP